MKVSQMKNDNGRGIPDQFIIYDTEHGFSGFQSYDSLIVKITADENGNRVVTLDENKWNYSTTTSKYRNRFLGETTKETKKKIAAGIYKLIDLNE
jgi:hypothetical protein